MREEGRGQRVAPGGQRGGDAVFEQDVSGVVGGERNRFALSYELIKATYAAFFDQFGMAAAE